MTLDEFFATYEDVYTFDSTYNDSNVSFMALEPGSYDYVYDDLDDILYEMDEPAFEDEETWTNERHIILGVLGDYGAADSTWYTTFSAVLYDTQNKTLHQLDIAPVSVDKFEQLPVITTSLDAFAKMLTPKA